MKKQHLVNGLLKTTPRPEIPNRFSATPLTFHIDSSMSLKSNILALKFKPTDDIKVFKTFFKTFVLFSCIALQL